MNRLASFAAAVALISLACDGADRNSTAAAPEADRNSTVAASEADRTPTGSSIGGLAAGGGRHFATHAHACAIIDGGLDCWGTGESGQLGDGTTVKRSASPVTAFPSGSGVTSVATGAEHTCAVRDGKVACWGSNGFAQIGAREPDVALAPHWVGKLPEPVIEVAAGARHSCAIAGDRAWCWGRNGHGQAGIRHCANPLAKCKEAPSIIRGLGGKAESVSLGASHSCALTSSGVSCWGANDRGQLGDGTTDYRDRPVRVEGLSGTVSSIAAGGNHTCATIDGEVWCWGANENGQLGDGSSQDRPSPVRVVGLSGDNTVVASGSRHTCVSSLTEVRCFGDNTEGQLNGTPGSAINSEPLLAHSQAVLRLAAGEDLTCAAASDASITCWGDNDFGQLGRIDDSGRREPRAPIPDEQRGTLADRDGDGRITVACLGDSNTQTFPQRPRNWCEMLRDLMPPKGFETVNRSEGGATAVTDGSKIQAVDHLEYALTYDSVDAVVMAYGTNDLLVAHAPPKEVVVAYQKFRERAREAGVDFFVALTPPSRSKTKDTKTSVVELNGEISNAFDASEVIDFFSDLQPDDFVDELHLGDSGQAKRAAAAWTVLKAATAN